MVLGEVVESFLVTLSITTVLIVLGVVVVVVVVVVKFAKNMPLRNIRSGRCNL